MKRYIFRYALVWAAFLFGTSRGEAQHTWNSQWLRSSAAGELVYQEAPNGDRLPDFSGVGFFRNRIPLPHVPVVMSLEPGGGDDLVRIQNAIDEVSRRRPDANGYRGALLLKKGLYRVSGTLRISQNGVVLRGEGAATRVLATAHRQHTLLIVSGTGNIREIPGRRTAITDQRVPVGAHSFNVRKPDGFHVGDSIILYRPATANWIADIRMDQIDVRDSNTLQWKPADYGLRFERVITRIEGNRISIDNPVVMGMDQAYGGGEIYAYQFPGRIRQVGVEDIQFESVYTNDTDEAHGWTAVYFNRIENAWATRVSSRFFGYSCINLGYESRNVTVTDCQYLDPKSEITGGRRYSFNNDGQLNLVMNCLASFGRHDYVTGARVCGPNVFYNCRSEHAQADIGPHHRWAAGTLYDNIVTDGEINVQDRGNWGTGHGWAGVTQVIWNCTVARAAIQNPWASGVNYVIGLKGKKYQGRLPGRPETEWEGQDRAGLHPASLYQFQLNQAIKKEK